MLSFDSREEKLTVENKLSEIKRLKSKAPELWRTFTLFFLSVGDRDGASAY